MKQVVVITGAANGIGMEIAAAFAVEGYVVIIGDIDKTNGEKVVGEIKNNGGEGQFILTNMQNPEDIENLFQQVFKEYGTINILINNAGVSRWKSVYDLTVIEWDAVLNTNLRGTFLASREAAKYMRRNEDGGAIVNIASTRAIMSEPNSEAYAASKGGILALTHALAASFSNDKITVNAISPGWIETNDYADLRNVDHLQHFSNRVGTSADIARACLFLTDNRNNFINGENLIIDGGMTRKMIYEE